MLFDPLRVLYTSFLTCSRSKIISCFLNSIMHSLKSLIYMLICNYNSYTIITNTRTKAHLHTLSPGTHSNDNYIPCMTIGEYYSQSQYCWVSYFPGIKYCKWSCGAKIYRLMLFISGTSTMSLSSFILNNPLFVHVHWCRRVHSRL